MTEPTVQQTHASRILSDAQLDEMAELREEGMSHKAIAGHFTKSGTPITASAIAYQCLRLGVVPATARATLGGSCGAQGRPFTAEEDARLLDLAGQGVGRQAIARTLGRAPNSVTARLYTLARRDTIAERDPAARPTETDRRRAARKRHRTRIQLEKARAKVARLEQQMAG